MNMNGATDAPTKWCPIINDHLTPPAAPLPHLGALRPIFRFLLRLSARRVRGRYLRMAEAGRHAHRYACRRRTDHLD